MAKRLLISLLLGVIALAAPIEDTRAAGVPAPVNNTRAALPRPYDELPGALIDDNRAGVTVIPTAQFSTYRPYAQVSVLNNTLSHTVH